MVAAGPADAHGGGHEPGQTDAEHAAMDRIGDTMDTIEAETSAAAARIAKATGVQPGAPSAKAASADLARAVSPAQAGKWSAIYDTEVVPVFQAVLPSGKVLMWDSVGDGATESYPDHAFTRAMVWNPKANTFRRTDVAGYNIFCAGYVQLPNGNVLVVGGNKDYYLNGIRQTHLFDWKTETWSRGPDMAAERWYPSVAALANGEAVIVAGGTDRAEVYQTDGTLRTLTGFSSFADRLYPYLVPRPDSRVEFVGPSTEMTTMNTNGAGAIEATTHRDGIFRDYASFATYDIGKTLVTGGGNVSEDGQTQVPTRTSVIVDTNSGTTATRSAASMSVGRRQHNLTVLADGTVLATGGQKKAVNGTVDLANAVFAAEQWNPATNSWRTLASASRIREYHSTATLLPDGRVLNGGGGICGDCTTQGYLEKDLQYFSPPYLFAPGGGKATRPTISGVPGAAGYSQQIAFTSPQASSLRKLSLMRLGAATHSVDQGQNYVPLDFTVSGTTVATSSPASSSIASPGYYMLIAVDAAGVPSVASMIQLQATTSPSAGGQVKGFKGRCLDAQNGVATEGAGVIMWDCGAGRPAQSWTYAPGDSTMRSSGKCMEFTGASPQSYADVHLATCNGSGQQRWERRTDGSIRPRLSGDYCLSVAAKATTAGAGAELLTCTGEVKVYQRWRW